MKNEQNSENTSQELVSGRIICETGTLFEVRGEDEVHRVAVGRSLLNEVRPAVGDWVTLDENNERIVAVEPRKSEIVRQAAGNRTKPQTIAANVDVVFVVTSMNQEFNESRLERYLTMIWNAGATPVVVLNKSDLAEDPQDFVDRAELAALGCPVVPVNALEDGGLEALRAVMEPDKTYLLVGSSGVGKSTITNALVGESLQETAGIREDDDEGRHTTTNRRLIELPGGIGSLIDTPGMRELQLWDAEDGLSETFADIEELAETCKFRDCQHESEPGCAVRRAIEEGDLDLRRFSNYLKLQRELEFHDKKRDVAATRAEHRKFARVVKEAKAAKDGKVY